MSATLAPLVVVAAIPTSLRAPRPHLYLPPLSNKKGKSGVARALSPRPIVPPVTAALNSAASSDGGVDIVSTLGGRCRRRRHSPLPLTSAEYPVPISMRGGGGAPSAAEGSTGGQSPSPSAPTAGASSPASVAAAASASGRGKAEARLCLAAVSFLYGTLNVSLKHLYSADGAPTAAALSCVRGWMTAAMFAPTLLASSRTSSSSSSSYGGAAGASRGGDAFPERGNGRRRTAPLWLSALELALWNCGSFALLNLGILLGESTTRASFLTQTSVVITPLLSLLAGQRVKAGVWAGCAVALAGLVMLSSLCEGADEEHAMVADMAGEVVPEHQHAHPHGASAAAARSDGGSARLMDAEDNLLLDAFPSDAFPPSLSLDLSASDLLVLGGAACWSLYLVRTSAIVKRHSGMRLQASLQGFKAGLYTLWAASAAALSAWERAGNSGGRRGWGEALQTLWPGWRTSPRSWLLLACTAVGPGAIAAVLHQRGQGAVSAGEANVLLSAEPVFTALCAWAVLGEVTTARERAGGAVIALAALLASGSLDGTLGRIAQRGRKSKEE